MVNRVYAKTVKHNRKIKAFYLWKTKEMNRKPSLEGSVVRQTAYESESRCFSKRERYHISKETSWRFVFFLPLLFATKQQPVLGPWRPPRGTKPRQDIFWLAHGLRRWGSKENIFWESQTLGSAEWALESNHLGRLQCVQSGALLKFPQNRQGNFCAVSMACSLFWEWLWLLRSQKSPW